MVTIAGLWLTPYLLHHLDQHDFGLWLLATQMLFYLGLMDVGVVALLPREIAFTTGRAGATLSGDLQELIGTSTRLVLWQFPFVAVLSAITWWVVASGWPLLALPFGVVAVTFVLTFPLRILQAVLQGMQDLTFLAGSQSLSWIAGLPLTVGLVASGFGIHSLAIGWMCTQVVATGLAWCRAATRYKRILPSRLPPMALGTARTQLRRGVWMSVSQIAQVLLNGTDVLIVAMLLGPAAIVPYACTGKLVTILASQPQLFMQAALPALSELRTSVPQSRLFQVSTSMSQLLLLCSGAIACVVLAVNESFVSWWVGEARFAGVGLTAVLVLGMLLRHWNLAAIYTLFCFGNERRLALTTAADGIVGVIAMLALVPWLGLYGAALGSLIGTATVSLPLNLSALARAGRCSHWRYTPPAGGVVRPLRHGDRRSARRDYMVARAQAWQWERPWVRPSPCSISYGRCAHCPATTAWNDAEPEDAASDRVPAPAFEASR